MAQVKDELYTSLLNKLAFSRNGFISALFIMSMMTFSACTLYVMVGMKAEREATYEQFKTFLASNVGSFATKNDVALRVSAKNLMKGGDIAYIFINDKRGAQYVREISEKIVEDADLQKVADIAEGRDKLSAEASSGSDLPLASLMSGIEIYRVYREVRTKRTKLGEVEMGFYREPMWKRVSDTMQLILIAGLSASLVFSFIFQQYLNHLQQRRAHEIHGFVTQTVHKKELEFEGKLMELKKKEKAKDVSGSNFFNLLESIRDIVGSEDAPSFNRRLVLSGVRLFKCRLVRFYTMEQDKPKFLGRYDAKGYKTDKDDDPLFWDEHAQLREAVQSGRTDILQGYPSGKSEAMVITIASDTRKCFMILQTKAGSFEDEDVIVARAYAGYLPPFLTRFAVSS